MKKQASAKKRIIIISLVVVIIIALIASAIFAVCVIAKNLYDDTNYVSDDNAMDNYEAVEDIEEIDPEDAKGETLTSDEESDLEAQMQDWANAEEITNDKNVYNVLLIGVDRREASWAGNSDSMILISLNYNKKQISMISLMRDTYVNIPGVGMRKLNAAHANGAGPLLLKTVTQNYKIQVDRYASVDFNGMIKIIDEVGGVDLTLSQAEVDVANKYIAEMCYFRGESPAKHYYKSAGAQHCSGIQAVAYARIRYVGHADYQRTERQRTILTKIFEKAKTMSVTELYNFANEVMPYVTHNIPEDEMWNVLAKAPSILGYDLVKDRIPYDGLYKTAYINRQDMLVPYWPETIKKLKETIY